MGTYRDLDVYQRSFNAAVAIYRFSTELPRYFERDIADDMRRAARSVPSNIAEGYSRNKSKADIKNFLKTALGSAQEVLFNLEFLLALGLIQKSRFDKAREVYVIICTELYRLIKTLTFET